MPHSGELWATMVAPNPALPAAVSLGASPATWTASKPGTLIVSGGTVSLVEIGRGASFVVAGLIGGMIPVSAGDQVRVTYLVAPTVTFLGR